VENLNLHPLREFYLQRFALFNLILILFFNLVVDMMHTRMSVRVLNYEKESAQGYAAAVRERIDAVRRVKHDTMHHINACNMLYTQGEYQRLGEYLQSLQTDGDAIAPLQYSNHIMIDYIVMTFSKRAEEKQISLQTDIAVLPDLSISDSDLCSLLNNVLQNAMDACMRLHDAEKRWIRLEIHADENKVFFTCENSCDGFFRQDGGRYLTTKQDGSSHGYGMSIIRGLCRNNGGAMASEINGNRFVIKVALPYRPANEKGDAQ
jgi:sensor histidine kinase regulating citrate/malate metabolism